MEYKLDVEDIRTLLPHRYPMLLVDRVLEITPGQRVVGLKNVTINEPYFNGHFPGQAVMPGVMILECMAQVAGLIMLSVPEHTGKLAYIGTINKARFRKPVIPGDTLIIEANLGKMRGDIGEAHMTAKVEGELVARCDMMFAMVTPPPPQVREKLKGE
jgi:3-hydroxyacyl-[acyl-carrier-protein] dehydratase